MKYLALFEESVTDAEKNPHAYACDVPAVKRLVSKLSKVLHPHHAEQGYKLVEQWNAFRGERNIDQNVTHVEHNRAAIIMKAAEQVCKLKEPLTEFFKDEDSSGIHQVINFDLTSTICGFEIAAVAYYFVGITDPFWKLLHGTIENGVYVKKKVHILDLIPQLRSLKAFLESLASDGLPLMEGETCFDEGFVEKDSFKLIQDLTMADDRDK